ncbi:hypothetical protein H0H93_016610, partial [Arthromyces matolae]
MNTTTAAQLVSSIKDQVDILAEGQSCTVAAVNEIHSANFGLQSTDLTDRLAQMEAQLKELGRGRNRVGVTSDSSQAEAHTRRSQPELLRQREPYRERRPHQAPADPTETPSYSEDSSPLVGVHVDQAPKMAGTETQQTTLTLQRLWDLLSDVYGAPDETTATIEPPPLRERINYRPLPRPRSA